MNNFYVYCWRYKDTKEVFYIGKGTKDRAYDISNSRNEYFKNIIKKHKNNVEVVILLDGLTEEEAWNKEKALIKLYWNKGQCKANFHEGGCGGNTGNYAVVGEKVRQFRATHELSDKQKAVVEKMHQAVRGVPKTREWKQKCRHWVNTYFYEVYLKGELIYWCCGRSHLYKFAQTFLQLGHGVIDHLIKEEFKPYHKKHQWVIDEKLTIKTSPLSSVSTNGDECNQVEWIKLPLEVRGVLYQEDDEIVSTFINKG